MKNKNVTFGLVIKAGKKLMLNQIIEIGAAIVPEGRMVYGPFAVQQGVTAIDVFIDSSQHSNQSVLVKCGVEASYNGGTTWQDVASLERFGGPINDEHGEPLNKFDLSAGIDQPTNNNRKVRFFLEVVGGSITTGGGTVEIKP